MRLIFVMGPSGSGKSTLASKIEDIVSLTREKCDEGNISQDDVWFDIAMGDCTIIEGSSWIRQKTGCKEHDDLAIEYLTKASLRALEQDPRVSLKYLRQIMDLHYVYETHVIAGLRNPVDFWGLWVPQATVIWLEGEAKSQFEKDGLSSILNDLDRKGAHVYRLKKGEWQDQDLYNIIENTEEFTHDEYLLIHPRENRDPYSYLYDE